MSDRLLPWALAGLCLAACKLEPPPAKPDEPALKAEEPPAEEPPAAVAEAAEDTDGEPAAARAWAVGSRRKDLLRVGTAREILAKHDALCLGELFALGAHDASGAERRHDRARRELAQREPGRGPSALG